MAGTGQRLLVERDLTTGSNETARRVHETLGAQTFFSGESTDVVAHEVGHGLVDSIRPDFFSVNFLEVAAFHEAAGDCVAVLTALSDLETRKALLNVTKSLKKRNFVESTAENVPDLCRLAVTSSGPTYASLDALVAASDVVVIGRARSVSPGRLFASSGAAIRSEIVELEVGAVLYGDDPGPAMALEEERQMWSLRLPATAEGLRALRRR